MEAPQGQQEISSQQSIISNSEAEPETTAFAEFESEVYAVAISPQGRQRIAVGLKNGTVEIWDVLTRTKWATCQGHTSSVISVAFNHDGTQMVSGSDDHSVRLWDVQTGKAIGQPFSGHNGSVNSVAFNHDGTQVVTGSDDNTVRLWNVQTGKAIGQPFSGHTGYVNSVTFNHDGTQVVSGSLDNTVRLWDISDPQRKRQIIIGKHKGQVFSVAVDPLGDYIISAGEDGIKVWRWEGFNITRVPQPFSNDQASGEDSLDVAKELQSLADVLMLRSLKPPLAVAILGSWGSGKSFGMHLIEKQITKIRCQKLEEKQTWGEEGDEPYLSPYVGHVYQIKFNAWSYAKSELWPSLMQTIFEQLDRQLTLEQQLKKVSDLRAGGKVWQVLNQINDSERKIILENELGQEVLAKLENGNTLWDILSQVKGKEKEKLEQAESKLKDLEKKLQEENQNIENEVNQEFVNKSILITFLTQLKELNKDDFGNSIFKDFLNHYGFKNKEELNQQIPIFDQLEKLEKSQIIEKIEGLVKTDDKSIKDFIQKTEKIKNFVDEQPSKIANLIEFIKQDREKDGKKHEKIFPILIIVCLPFIIYAIILIISTYLPLLKEIASALTIVFTTLLTTLTPLAKNAIETFKKFRTFQAKTTRVFKAAQESLEQEKQKLAADKDQKIQSKIESATSEKQKEIEKLKAEIEKQKQRVGLTAQYTSLLDFVNDRLEDNSYQKLLGIMHQVQDDLQDLSDHLTYTPGKTNPEKLDVLKPLFPRGPARIVLYIDDLDRCPPHKVVEVLEAVQLLLNTELFIVVLAIDDRYIGRALEKTYQGVLKRGGTPSGVDYIEKIVQIPYRMRPMTKEVAEGYLKSLLHIEEEAKPENQNRPEPPQETLKINPNQQTTKTDIIILPPEATETSFAAESLPENYELNPENITNEHQDFEKPVFSPSEDIEEKENTPTSESNSTEDKLKQNHSEKQQKQNFVNTDPLVDFQRFTAEEFRWIKECCQHVDLTPRTAKRLINICKIIKIIWTPTENDTTWKEPPTEECKQTLIALLALAGRYPKEMRKILAEIYLEFEETDENTITIYKNQWLENLDHSDVFVDMHTQREWKKFKNDFHKMPPEEEFVFEKRTFNLATSFCFVGDIGYDPDDNSNREYR
ncbi:MAG: P-loop NTPase fold protein [Cuspidothrix sp.]